MEDNYSERNLNVKQFLSKDNKIVEKLKKDLFKFLQDEENWKSLNDAFLKEHCKLQVHLEKLVADEVKLACLLENTSEKAKHKSNQQANLTFLCKLLGYHIMEYNESEVNYIKVNCEQFCVILRKDQSQYEVLDIHPDHSNFREIKQFLSVTQDLIGMLNCLKQYFAVTASTEG
uniref:Kinetochore protein SPC25 n=1 Tax=Glossina brevipalpis TaxID=37001 RepID=A0A1A9WVM8_9MUSC